MFLHVLTVAADLLMPILQCTSTFVPIILQIQAQERITIHVLMHILYKDIVHVVYMWTLYILMVTYFASLINLYVLSQCLISSLSGTSYSLHQNSQYMWSMDMPHSQQEYPIIGLSLVAPFSACTKVYTNISTTQCTCVPDVEVLEDLRVEIINLSRHIQNIANTIYGKKNCST